MGKKKSSSKKGEDVPGLDTTATSCGEAVAANATSNDPSTATTSTTAACCALPPQPPVAPWELPAVVAACPSDLLCLHGFHVLGGGCSATASSLLNNLDRNDDASGVDELTTKKRKSTQPSNNDPKKKKSLDDDKESTLEVGTTASAVDYGNCEEPFDEVVVFPGCGHGACLSCLAAEAAVLVGISMNDVLGPLLDEASKMEEKKKKEKEETTSAAHNKGNGDSTDEDESSSSDDDDDTKNPKNKKKSPQTPRSLGALSAFSKLTITLPCPQCSAAMPATASNGSRKLLTSKSTVEDQQNNKQSTAVAVPVGEIISIVNLRESHQQLLGRAQQPKKGASDTTKKRTAVGSPKSKSNKTPATKSKGKALVDSSSEDDEEEDDEGQSEDEDDDGKTPPLALKHKLKSVLSSSTKKHQRATSVEAATTSIVSPEEVLVPIVDAAKLRKFFTPVTDSGPLQKKLKAFWLEVVTPAAKSEKTKQQSAASGDGEGSSAKKKGKGGSSEVVVTLSQQPVALTSTQQNPVCGICEEPIMGIAASPACSQQPSSQVQEEESPKSTNATSKGKGNQNSKNNKKPSEHPQVVACFDCGFLLCGTCAGTIHSKGKFKQHKTVAGIAALTALSSSAPPALGANSTAHRTEEQSTENTKKKTASSQHAGGSAGSLLHDAAILGRKCPLHPLYPLELYCQQCKECACLRCHFNGPHKHHSVISLEDIRSTVSADVETANVTLSEAFSRMFAVSSVLHQEGEHAVDKQAQEVLTAIEQESATLQQEILRRELIAKEQVRRWVARRKAMISIDSSLSYQSSRQLQALVRGLPVIVGSKHITDVLALHAVIQSRVGVVSNRAFPAALNLFFEQQKQKFNRPLSNEKDATATTAGSRPRDVLLEFVPKTAASGLNFLQNVHLVERFEKLLNGNAGKIVVSSSGDHCSTGGTQGSVVQQLLALNATAAAHEGGRDGQCDEDEDDVALKRKLPNAVRGGNNNVQKKIGHISDMLESSSEDEEEEEVKQQQGFQKKPQGNHIATKASAATEGKKNNPRASTPSSSTSPGRHHGDSNHARPLVQQQQTPARYLQLAQAAAPAHLNEELGMIASQWTGVAAPSNYQQQQQQQQPKKHPRPFDDDDDEDENLFAHLDAEGGQDAQHPARKTGRQEQRQAANGQAPQGNFKQPPPQFLNNNAIINRPGVGQPVGRTPQLNVGPPHVAKPGNKGKFVLKI